MKKKKITYKNVIAILFSLFIFGYFITVGERFVRSSFLNHNFDENMKFETEVAIDPDSTDSGLTDWSKLYPLQESEEDESVLKEEKAEIKESGKLEKIKNTYTEFIGSIEGKIDYYTSKLLFMRMKFVELNAKFNKIIGNKLISGSDEVIAMGDGNLTYRNGEYDLTKSGENLADFSEYLSEKGIPLLYVQAPSKVDPDNNYLPGGMTDYDNQNVDRLISVLDKNGVNYLDLRKSMKQQGMNFTESFYRTDHHWKISTALWAADQIAESLSNHGLPYRKDLLDINNYNEKLYKNFMLGSLGKKVTLAFTDPEDFSMYLPKFDTDFTVEYHDFRKVNGSFKDTMINMSVFDKVDYYGSQVYGAYFYGMTAVVTVENHKADNDKRIVFIGDSFVCSVAPYLSTQYRYLDKVDLRYFNGGIKSYIEKNKTDAVVVLYYPTSLANGSKYGMMNFR